MKTLHKTLFTLVFLLYSLNASAQPSIASWTYQGGGTTTGPNPAGLDTTSFPGTNNRLFSPIPGDLDNDGDMDLIVGTQSGILFYYENIGTPSSPSWVRTSHPNLDTLIMLPFSTSNEVRPQLEDIDNDGDLDLFIGVRYNYVTNQWGQSNSETKFRDIIYFENTGTPSNSIFERAYINGVDHPTDFNQWQNTGEFTNIGFVDIDNDGDRDFFTIGSDSINYFQNIGTATAPSFQRYFRNDAPNPLGPLSSPTYTSMLISMPDFEDFDNDGDFDLYFVNETGFVQFVENIGTAGAPNFSPYTPVQGSPAISTGLESDLGGFGCLIFEDFDNDNVKDAIHGNFNPGTLDWWKGIPNCNDTIASFSNTACGSYTVPSGDETYTTGGIYKDTIPTLLGCDSVLTITLTINTLDDASFSYTAANFCVNDTDPAATVTGLLGGTFSSTAGLSINASSGIIDVSASTAGTYIVTYTTSGTCPNSSDASITVNALDDASFSYTTTTFCANDTDPVATVTGVLGGTFSSTAGLSINASSGTIDLSASTAGTYTITYTTSGTCPNSSTTSMTINALDDASFTYTAGTFCVNDVDPVATVTGLLGGIFSSTAGLSINASSGTIDLSASTAGTYTVTYITSGSCPNSSTASIIITALDDASFNYTTASFCVNDTDPVATVSGALGGTFSSTTGLSINVSSGTIDLSASTAGTYTITYTTSGGCSNSSDQSVTINDLDDASFSYTTSSFCVNDTDPVATVVGLLGGTFSSTAGLSINASSGTIDVSASTAGTYTVTYTTSGTCPNSSTASVTINALDNASFSYSAASFCVNDTDPVATVTGVLGGTFSSTAGLSINASLGTIDVSASTAGTYSITYTTSGTCPNSSTADVTINALDDASFSYTATSFCVNDTDPIATATGVLGGTFSSASGLSINASSGTIDVSASTAGTYTVTYTTSGTCPNSSTFDVTINAVSTGIDTQVACDNYTWIDGNAYTASNNTATFTLTNAAGCDSLVTLDLTINNSTTGTDTQVACDTYTWINGNAYTTSNNTATFVLTNAAGCDSTVTLDLTINNSSTGTDTQIACDTYTWIDGNTYTASNNSATFVLTNAVGCDSTVTLDLTINNSTTGTDTQVACDTYTWIDGNTYTISNNSATFVLTNAVGCDSTVTLDLTINNSNTGTDVQIACDTYTWIDGNTYTTSNNTATFVLTNAAGCDSTVTLDLTINNSNTGTDVQIACDTYTWIDGNAYTASNNAATFVLTNAAGCDSTVTLDLTINNSTTGTDTQVACDTFTWIDGNTYAASNNSATFVLTNAVGCDSTVTLDLTINNSTTGIDTQVACDTYTWIDGNTYSSSNNTATFTLMNSVGCDSLITLDLTINTTNIGTSQSADGVTITADATPATYQWIDCDNNNAVISGETNQSFTATVNGNYAVIVNQNNCIDTSNCVNVSTVGLETLLENPVMKVYPNPTKGNAHIELGKVYDNVEIRVLNVSGQLVSQQSFIGTDFINLAIEGEVGVYFLEVRTNLNVKAIHRIVKQ